MWCPAAFIPPHVEDTDMQGAYQQSRTKGSLLVGGGCGLLGTGRLDEEISLQLFLQHKRHSDSCMGGGVRLRYVVCEDSAKMLNAADERLTGLSKACVRDRRKPAPVFPELHHFIVYFPR